MFRAAGRTYAEGLVFALFVSARQLLLWLLFTPVLSTPALPGYWLLLFGGLGISFGYYAWAARKFFGLRDWPIVARSAAALVLTGITCALILTALLGLLAL